MRNNFVTYEQSFELKKLGFNLKTNCSWRYNHVRNLYFLESSLAWINYNDDDLELSAPLFQQVIDWADINYGLLGYITKYNDNTYDWVIINPNITSPIDHGDGPFKTRQEAKHTLISVLIETIKLLNK